MSDTGQQQSQILTCMRVFDGHLETFHKLNSILEERLNVILLNPSPETENNKPNETMHTQLASSLRTRLDKFSICLNRMESLMHRIDLPVNLGDTDSKGSPVFANAIRSI